MDSLLINDLKKLFSWALTWSSIESVLYYSTLTLHTIGLFYYATPTVYGLQAAIFATTFLCITLLNGAFDISLIPVFAQLNKTREGRIFLIKRLLYQGVLLFTVPYVIGMGMYCLSYSIFNNTIAHYLLSPKNILFFSCLILTEGIKKNLRALLHFAFHYKILTFIECLNIISYVTLVWGAVYYKRELSIDLLLQLFFIVSLITVIILIIIFTYHNKKQIFHKPQQLLISVSESSKIFLKTRILCYSNQIIRTVFSGNFLLPFLTLKVGIDNIGLITLINGITYTGTNIIQRILGAVGATFLAHIHNHKDTVSKKEIVTWLTTISTTLSIIFIIFFMIVVPHFFSLSAIELSNQTVGLIMLFLCVHITESSFIIYEKLLIADNKMHLLLYLNSAHGITCLGASYLSHQSSLVFLLVFCLTTRLLFLTIFKQLYDRKYKARH